MGLGILLFIYVCVCRFANDFHNLNQYFKDKTNGDEITISKGLLLDICPFVCFALLISIIVDPTRRMAQVLSPFALFGGLITICALSTVGDVKFTGS
jgi:hypothetical protein